MSNGLPIQCEDDTTRQSNISDLNSTSQLCSTRRRSRCPSLIITQHTSQGRCGEPELGAWELPGSECFIWLQDSAQKTDSLKLRSSWARNASFSFTAAWKFEENVKHHVPSESFIYIYWWLLCFSRQALAQLQLESPVSSRRKHAFSNFSHFCFKVLVNSNEMESH